MPLRALYGHSGSADVSEGDLHKENGPPMTD
jgi:hypothetical protein